MPSVRRAIPIPVPPADLGGLRESLAPYACALHTTPATADGTGKAHRTLVVRIPRRDPDLVNDAEAALDRLDPAAFQEAEDVLLLGDVHASILPIQPLRDLLASRVAFDRSQAALLRSQLKHGEDRTFKAPEDPRRLVRLALRLPLARVADLTEEHLLQLARGLGPRLGKPPLSDVKAVHLVADKDDVRLDAADFLADLQARFTEESERRRLAEEVARKEAAMRPPPPPARPSPIPGSDERLSDALRRLRDGAPEPRSQPDHAIVAHAPLRRAAPATAAWEAEPARASMYAHIDALVGGRGPDPSTRPPPTTQTAAPIPAPVPVPPPVATLVPSPHLQTLKATLERCGYAVLLRPAGAGLDLAAERASFPNRVVAWAPDRLDVPTAERALATARALKADLGFVVATDADAEARKRLIATTVRWLDPVAAETLEL